MSIGLSLLVIAALAQGGAGAPPIRVQIPVENVQNRADQERVQHALAAIPGLQNGTCSRTECTFEVAPGQRVALSQVIDALATASDDSERPIRPVAERLALSGTVEVALGNYAPDRDRAVLDAIGGVRGLRSEVLGAGQARLTIVDASAGQYEWYCTMHPEIIRDAAGNCPTCGMTLTRRQRTVQPASVTVTSLEQAACGALRCAHNDAHRPHVTDITWAPPAAQPQRPGGGSGHGCGGGGCGGGGCGGGR